VRWGVASQVVWAWILTIPGAFLIAAATSLVVRALG
jgi:phosphate/sulfate permease